MEKWLVLILVWTGFNTDLHENRLSSLSPGDEDVVAAMKKFAELTDLAKYVISKTPFLSRVQF